MEKIIMSKKEIKVLPVIDRLAKGEINQKEAAIMLQLSTRQIRRKLKQYHRDGATGLIHKNRGMPSKRKWKLENEAFVLGLLRTEWFGFGPTFVAEKLFEIYKIKASSETLRRIMIKASVWHVKQQRPKHRKWRERKQCFGELIQLDGSPHDWFEGRGEKCTLLVFIDDATSKIVWLEFVKSESNKDVIQAVRHYIEKHGRPIVFYTDYGSVFSVNTNNPDHDKKTQLGRILQELDIHLSLASSPQAKGRVERSNKTHQDRLVKELRIEGISRIEEANKYIQETYLSRHNSLFAIEPVSNTNMHRSCDSYDLNAVFCLKNKRILMNDFTISYQNRLFQIEKQKTILRPKDEIIVHELFDGAISLWIRQTKLFFNEIKQRPTKPTITKIINQNIYRPPANHPWCTFVKIDKNIQPSNSNRGLFMS